MPDAGAAWERVRSLEERAFNAWPALETLLVDGWVLRFANGYTKRANSINAWMPRCAALEIAGIAAPLYGARKLPVVFRLSPLAGPGDDGALAEAGYRMLDETVVMTARLGSFAADPAVVLEHAPQASWCDGFADTNRVPASRRVTHDTMIGRIVPAAAFACAAAVPGGPPVAFGLGVAERGMIGVFDVVTRPEARQQGIARRLVTSLLAWGQAVGASEAYLQVLATNGPAIALYGKLGFVEAYRYHYRVAPAADQT